MAKKFIVRDGFVVVLKLVNPKDQSVFERTYNGGEECTLEDDQAAQHWHKLEFASQKDRDAALAAERQALQDERAGQSPADLVKALVAALAQAQQAGGVQAPAPATP